MGELKATVLGAHLLPPPLLVRRDSPVGSRSRCLGWLAARLAATGCLHCWHCQRLQRRRLTCSATSHLCAQPDCLIKHVQTRTCTGHVLVRIPSAQSSRCFGWPTGIAQTHRARLRRVGPSPFRRVGDARFGSSIKKGKFVQVLSCSGQRSDAACLCDACVCVQVTGGRWHNKLEDQHFTNHVP